MEQTSPLNTHSYIYTYTYLRYTLQRKIFLRRKLYILNISAEAAVTSVLYLVSLSVCSQFMRLFMVKVCNNIIDQAIIIYSYLVKEYYLTSEPTQKGGKTSP